MTNLYLIDSSAWLFNLGPNPMPEIRERLSFLVKQGLAAVTGPILFEILSFPGAGGVRVVLAQNLLALTVVPFMASDWREAAQWTAAARSKGSSVRSMDALIAFTAHKHGLTLLHADADLDKLARRVRLKVESYVSAARNWSKGPKRKE